MSSGLELIVVFASFFTLLGLGVTVPFAILIPGIFYLFLQGGWSALNSIGLISWASMNSFTLTAIPLFILMTEILEQSKLTSRIYSGLSKLVSWLPGGLLQTNIAGCAMFSAISGSSIATAASVGSVSLPQLLSRSYNRSLSAGSVAAGGTLGILIPPSLAMIIYSSLTETSVAKLFIAGAVPGIVLMLLFMLYIGLAAKLRPSLAPREENPTSLVQIAAAILQILPFMILIAAMMGSIYLGLATPTEVAGLGCVFVLIIAAIWGELSWATFQAALQRAAILSGSILFIVYAASLFSHAVSFGGVGSAVTEYILSLNLSPIEFIIVLFALYIVMGCLVESIGMIVITVPLLFPVLTAYGFDPIWFGILLVMFVELGMITPPVGINLFVIQGIWSGTFKEVVVGTFPFVLILIVLIVLLVVWPDLALWLPEQMFKSMR